VELLGNREIGLSSLTEEAIDTTTAGGKLVFHVFGVLAEFECSIINECTKAGLNAARARGKKGGNQHLTQKDVAAAKAMLSDPDITVEEVAKRFNVAPSTLYRHMPGGKGGILENSQ
jgi:DNA invertase Pin-like site-specific DNA recombinase